MVLLLNDNTFMMYERLINLGVRLTADHQHAFFLYLLFGYVHDAFWYMSADPSGVCNGSAMSSQPSVRDLWRQGYGTSGGVAGIKLPSMAMSMILCHLLITVGSVPQGHYSSFGIVG